MSPVPLRISISKWDSELWLSEDSQQLFNDLMEVYLVWLIAVISSLYGVVQLRSWEQIVVAARIDPVP